MSYSEISSLLPRFFRDTPLKINEEVTIERCPSCGTYTRSDLIRRYLKRAHHDTRQCPYCVNIWYKDEELLEPVPYVRLEDLSDDTTLIMLYSHAKKREHFLKDMLDVITISELKNIVADVLRPRKPMLLAIGIPYTKTKINAELMLKMILACESQDFWGTVPGDDCDIRWYETALKVATEKRIIDKFQKILDELLVDIDNEKHGLFLGNTAYYLGHLVKIKDDDAHRFFRQDILQ